MIKREYKQPLVYLHSFPPTTHCCSISPFALKVESYLRAHNIPYEMVYTSQVGEKKMIPYMRLGHPDEGEEVSDSNVMLQRLKRDYGDKLDQHLTPEQNAIAHAFFRMLEEHTSQIAFHYRYGLNMPSFCEVLDIPDRLFHATTSRKGAIVSSKFMEFQPAYTMQKTRYRGLANHTDEELWEFSNQDIKALSDFLGTQDYFFGDEATSLDCAVFGHLSQLLYIPLPFPQKKYMQEECENLVDFMERFRNEYWSDWIVRCEKQPNKKYTKSDHEDGDYRSLSRTPMILLSGVVLGAALWFSKESKRQGNK